jgi:endonuclease/exonuclease/phosphatase (EEP) superfamily protein YafD
MMSWWVPPYAWPVPLMSALSWMYLGGLSAGYFFWRDKRWRWYWLIHGLVWVLMLSLNWQFGIRSRNGGSGPTLRIATWNMDAAHYARRQIKTDLAFIRRMEADVFCLQEVYLGDYTPEAFAKEAGYPYILFAKAGPAVGMAILSRYPIWSKQSPLLLRGATNGLLVGAICLPSGETLAVANVHYPSYRLGRLSSWQYRHWKAVWQSQALLDQRLAHLVSGVPAISLWICGDFNAIPLSHAWMQWNRRGFTDSFVEAAWLSGPTWHPFPLRIDYIWSWHWPRRQRLYWQPSQQHACITADYGMDRDQHTSQALSLNQSSYLCRKGR